MSGEAVEFFAVLVVVALAVPVVGLTIVLLRALHGTTPEQRPEILKQAVPLSKAWFRRREPFAGLAQLGAQQNQPPQPQIDSQQQAQQGPGGTSPQV